jgi:hypothetical protein
MLLTMLTLIPIWAMIGLVGDVGWSYYTKGAAEAAAQAAAIAAVRSAMDYVAAGANYDCSSSSVVCQAAANCPSVIPNPPTNNIQNGCAYASYNGFTSAGASGSQTVTLEANNTNHAPTAPGITVSYWVTVRISKVNPLSFLSVLGFNSATVTARSTAAVVYKTPPSCVVSLDPSAPSAFIVGGTANVTLSNCAAQVNSTDSSALNLNGGGCLSATAINVVGQASTDACTPSANTGANAISDPFAALPAPSSATQPCDYNNTHVNGSSGTTALSPGVYCGGLSVGSAVTLSPGTYILKGGGLSCNSSCAISGTGVTFYNTCNSGFCNGGSTGYQPITINGSGSVNLSAPTSGSLNGILFFQDRTVNNPHTDSILGGSSTSLEGTLYFPNSTLKYAGNFAGADASTFLIANQVNFIGNSSLQISPTGTQPAWAPTASLIE